MNAECLLALAAIGIVAWVVVRILLDCREDDRRTEEDGLQNCESGLTQACLQCRNCGSRAKFDEESG